MFKKIVVGTDGSTAAETALRMACEIGKKFGSELHLVHTPQPQTAAFATGAIAGYPAAAAMPSEEEVQEAANAILQSGAKIAEDCGLPIAETHSTRGNPVAEIISCAETCGADLIVTGRRGLGNLSAMVLGSTSQGISHNAKCAVMTVP